MKQELIDSEASRKSFTEKNQEVELTPRAADETRHIESGKNTLYSFPSTSPSLRTLYEPDERHGRYFDKGCKSWSSEIDIDATNLVHVDLNENDNEVEKK